VIRAFVAATVSEKVLDRLSAIGRDLRALELDARWPHPQSLHLTLKFLGDVDDRQVEQIAPLMGEVGRQHGPFPVGVSGLGVFPHPANPRVLWIGVEEDGALFRLRGDIEASLAEIGFPAEGRPFHPHLTLARIRSRRNIARLIHFVEAEGPQVKAGGFEVVEFHLYQSILRPQGAEYRILSTFPLSA
jgi:RNA 2',3'-cyclic 3'-phosphodiesterase